MGTEDDKDDLRDNVLYPSGTYLLYPDEDARELKLAIKSEEKSSAKAKLKKFKMGRDKQGKYFIKSTHDPNRQNKHSTLTSLIKANREKYQLDQNYVILRATQYQSQSEDETDVNEDEDGMGDYQRLQSVRKVFLEIDIAKVPQ